MNWSWSLSLYDGPLMFNTELWWRSLSNKALVRTGSPNTSGHLENVRFVVIIVLDFSYLFAMRLKNRLAVSASIFSYPNSSTIRSLYLQIHLILLSSLFSYLAFLSCAMRSWNEIQYTEYLCFAASVPIPTARCVLPTPGVPHMIIFSQFSMNLNVARSSIFFLSSEGWKLKSNSLVLRQEKVPVKLRFIY